MSRHLAEGCGGMHDCTHVGSNEIAPLVIGGSPTTNGIARFDVDRTGVLIGTDGVDIAID